MSDMTDEKMIMIVYKNAKPYGIRDDGGFLFFFSKISKYTGQEERYRQEIEEQFKLADFLLEALKEKQPEWDEIGIGDIYREK